MVLGFDIHVIGINPPQSSACNLCLALGSLEPVTLAYTPGSGNFSLVDLEIREALEGGDSCEAAPAPAAAEATHSTHGAHLAHRIQQQQEEFIASLKSISISVIGRHGKMLSNSGLVTDSIAVPLVPPGSYMRHTSDDKFALQNDTMLLLARNKLKVRVSDATGPAHAASLSSYTANVTLSVSVYDVNMDPNTDLRVASTGRVVAGWKAREAGVVEAAAAAAVRRSSAPQNSQQPRDLSVHVHMHGDAPAPAPAPASVSVSASESHSEGCDWEPASPLYDSLGSSNNESEDEDEAAQRRVERDRREISMFFQEREEILRNPQLAEKEQEQENEPLPRGTSVENWVEGLQQAVSGARKSMEQVQQQHQEEQRQRQKIELKLEQELKHEQTRQRGKVNKTTAPAQQKGTQRPRQRQGRQGPQGPLHSRDMNLRLDAYPKDIAVAPPPAPKSTTNIVPTRQGTSQARETGGVLRVGRGAPLPTSAEAESGARAGEGEGARAGAGAGEGEGEGARAAQVDTSTDKKFLKKRSGIVGKEWRQHVAAAAHGQPKPLSRAQADKENKAKQEVLKLQREAALIAKAARDRDKTARLLGGIPELGGLGHMRPVTVRASYSTGKDGKVHSSYERSTLLRSTRVIEAKVLSDVKRVSPAVVPGAVQSIANAADRLAQQQLDHFETPAVPHSVPAAAAVAGAKPKVFDQLLMPLPPPVYDPIIYFHR